LMINKKTFLSVAASGLLALFSFNAGADVSVTSPEDDTFYAKVFYNGVKVHATKEVKDAKSGADEYKPEYELGKLGGGAALGYYFSGVRVELEGLMFSAIESKGVSTFIANSKNYTNYGFSHISGFLNAYYDVALSDMFVPYIGGGAGVSYGKFTTGKDVDKKEESALHIALRGKAGASLAFSDAFVPYAGYSLLWMLDKEYKIYDNTNVDEAKAKVGHLLHNLELGVMVPLS
jgi:opacity protein-like surface antigen